MPTYHVHRAAMLCAMIFLAARSPVSADQFIVPTPKKAAYHNVFFPLQDARIVTSNTPSKQVQFGIEQLRKHITNLGGDAPAVGKYSDFVRDPVSPPVAIIVGKRNDSFIKEFLPDGITPSSWQTGEGYSISTLRRAVGYAVVCRGYDDRGTYYALQSLIQLINARKDPFGRVSVWLRSADIEDWPSFKVRILPYAAWAGPEYMEWVAQYKLNVAGIHYPVAKEWRNLPEDYLKKSDAACKFAKDTGVIDAIQYLNPYVTYPESSPVINLLNQGDIDQLVASFDHFLSSGGTMVSLCVDDFFRMTPEVRQRFESHSEAQAFLVNQVYQPLKKRHPNMTMIFCPQWYAGVLQDREKSVGISDQTSNFSKDLGRHYWYLFSHIPEDILVFWTGPKVRSHEITADQLSSFTKIAGRKPLLWDNTFYDFHPTSFVENLFDPYPCDNKYPKDLYKYLDRQGIHLNSDYNEVSKVGFLTASDYFWNPAAFDPEKSLKNALDRVAGPEATGLMIEFRDDAVDLYKLIRARERSDASIPASEVRMNFERLKQLMARIRLVCKNKPLVEELDRHWIGDAEQKIEKLFPPTKD